MKIVHTVKATYHAYVNSGLWKVTKAPSYHKLSTAVAEVEAKVKGSDQFIPAKVYIRDYYTKDEIQRR